MLRVEFVAEDLHIVAERDIKEAGKWATNVSDTFESKFQVEQLTDETLGWLLLLVADGDNPRTWERVPDEIEAFLNRTFTEVRPYP